MAEVTWENQTDDERFEDAFDVMEYLGHGLDFNWSPTEIHWKVFFTPTVYALIKHDPDGYLYERDGQEYVKVFDNHEIPFLVHMRVGGIDDSIPEYVGCRREVDED